MNKKHRITVYIPKEFIKPLKRAALEADKSLSAVFEEIVRDLLGKELPKNN